jgi:Arc/MetJ family transcription regulator
MRTNIVIDDNLVSDAFRYSEARTKKELIHTALVEFVENHSRKNLRDLKGKVRFRKGYNYKALRRDSVQAPRRGTHDTC